MKKIFSLILALVMLACVTACSAQTTGSSKLEQTAGSSQVKKASASAAETDFKLDSPVDEGTDADKVLIGSRLKDTGGTLDQNNEFHNISDYMIGFPKDWFKKDADHMYMARSSQVSRDDRADTLYLGGNDGHGRFKKCSGLDDIVESCKDQLDDASFGSDPDWKFVSENVTQKQKKNVGGKEVVRALGTLKFESGGPVFTDGYYYLAPADDIIAFPHQIYILFTTRSEDHIEKLDQYAEAMIKSMAFDVYGKRIVTNSANEKPSNVSEQFKAPLVMTEKLRESATDNIQYCLGDYALNILYYKAGWRAKDDRRAANDRGLSAPSHYTVYNVAGSMDDESKDKPCQSDFKSIVDYSLKNVCDDLANESQNDYVPINLPFDQKEKPTLTVSDQKEVTVNGYKLYRVEGRLDSGCQFAVGANIVGYFGLFNPINKDATKNPYPIYTVFASTSTKNIPYMRKCADSMITTLTVYNK